MHFYSLTNETCHDKYKSITRRACKANPFVSIRKAYIARQLNMTEIKQ